MTHVDASGGAGWERLGRRQFPRIGGLAGAGVFVRFPGLESSLGAFPPVVEPGTTGHALVIGISSYKLKKFNDIDLTLPQSVVDEACEVVNWLVEKGGVDAKNITLLTNPLVNAPKKGVAVQEATRPNILDAMVEIGGRPGAATKDRLYFYYSGHGTRFDPIPYGKNDTAPADPADGIIPHDFKPGGTDALQVFWLLNYFKYTSFPEQFSSLSRNENTLFCELWRNETEQLPLPIFARLCSLGDK